MSHRSYDCEEAFTLPSRFTLLLAPSASKGGERGEPAEQAMHNAPVEFRYGPRITSGSGTTGAAGRALERSIQGDRRAD